jgi:hypothetical protein
MRQLRAGGVQRTSQRDEVGEERRVRLDPVAEPRRLPLASTRMPTIASRSGA